MACNPSVIVYILSTKFSVRNPSDFQEEISDEENRFADIISDLISKKSRGECDIDEDFYLYDDLDGSDDDEDEDVSAEPMAGPSSSQMSQEEVAGSEESVSEEESSDEPIQSSSSSYQPSPKKAAPMRIDEQYSLDQMKAIIEFVDKRGSAAALKRWTSLGTAVKIARIREFLEKGGHRLSKLEQLKNIVYTHFRDARDHYLPVHGHDLKGWSIEAARIVSLPSFKASASFLRSLKAQFRISSRKVTKFITKRTRTDEHVIERNARNFVAKINDMKITLGFPSSHVWNTDQSGFNYELSSGRTLSDKGEKETFAMVQSVNSLTHSYTVQVLISNDGYLAPKLFICFQESSGKFGPRVQERVRESQPANIIVTCTTSGKLTKSSLGFWVSSCLDPIVNDKTLLLQDSWTTQGDREVYDRNLKNSSLLQIETIPPKATRYIQPLDVYFFRQYKIMVRRFQDDVRCSATQSALTRLNDRVFIMQMHSFVYNQLSSSRFRHMLLYAWKASGYSIDEPLSSFENVLEVCFRDIFEDCSVNQCSSMAFIRCSHCNSPLCSYHCLNPLHFH